MPKYITPKKLADVLEKLLYKSYDVHELVLSTKDLDSQEKNRILKQIHDAGQEILGAVNSMEIINDRMRVEKTGRYISRKRR